MGGKVFGERASFAVEVGKCLGEPGAQASRNGSMRRVDLWAAGQWLTRDDNQVYVPHFAGTLARDVDFLLRALQTERLVRPWPELPVLENFRRLRADATAGDNQRYLAYRFMDWGPTSDNMSAVLFCEGGHAQILFVFARPKRGSETSDVDQVFVAELPALELVEVLHGAAWMLLTDWADRSGES